jgi:hypothetical protein
MKKSKLLLLMSSVCTSILVISCGGGSSSPTASSSNPAAASDISISGSVATGLAMINAPISAKCSNDKTGTATSDSDGAYTLKVVGGVAPCIIQATDPSTNDTYYSVAASGATTVNVTPLTQLVAANVLGVDPSTAVASFGSNFASKVTSAKVDDGVTTLKTTLTSLGITLPDNPMTKSFTPAQPDSGVSQDAHDQLIDQLMGALNAAKISITTTTTDQATKPSILSAMTNTSATPATTVTSIVTTQNANGNIVSTSAASGCPYARTGSYVTSNFGSGDSTFGLIVINFGSSPITIQNPTGTGTSTLAANKLLKGDGSQMTISQTDVNGVSSACRFFATDVSNNKMEFDVSPAGFLVGSSKLMGNSTDSLYNSAVMSTSLAPTSLKFGIGIPVQSQISAAEVSGTWQSAGWLKAPNKGYTNIFQYFDVISSSDGTSGTGKSYTCEGGVTCDTVNFGTFNLTKCSDCYDPTGGLIKNMFKITDTNSGTDMRVVLFKAPNNDLIGVFSGFTTINNISNILEYGVIYRPASNATLPANGKVVTNPQWQLSYSNNNQTLFEKAQIYSTSNVTPASGSTPASVKMTYSNEADKGNYHTVLIDKPRKGMVYREGSVANPSGNASVPNANNNNSATVSPMVGLRGNGWSISGGTTKLSDYFATNTVTSGTGKFFSVNVKY